jgi:hypothetical protein
LISPPGASSVSLEFFTFNLQAGDTLFVYDGNSSSATLIGAYSGSVIPAAVASSGAQMFIRFVTDGQTTASGWSAHYRSEYCDGLKVFSNIMSGTISDGSGTESYNNNTNCYWLITDTANLPVHLDFTAFATEASFDFVDVYDGTSTSANLLGSFSGHNLPPSIVSTGGALLIHFYSDGGVVDQGWEASFYICGKADLPYNSNTESICDGDSILLSIPVVVDSFVWRKDGQPVGVQSTQWYVAQSGYYSYDAYSGQCPVQSSDSVYVKVNPLPLVDLGNDTLICTSSILVLDAGAGFSSYLWSTGDTTRFFTLSASNAAILQISVEVRDTNSCANSDSILVEIIDCTGINETGRADIKLFPNPVESTLYIEFARTLHQINIIIYDLQGREVLRKEMDEAKAINLDISDFAAGTYYLKVGANQLFFSEKLIKQ